MKRLLGMIALCALLLPLAAMGQRRDAQERPTWIDGYFYEANNSYVESVSATGPTEDEARNKAAAVAIERRSLSTGKRVQVQVRGERVIVTGEDELTVKARILDEYREHYAPGEYRVYLLVQTAKNPTFEFDRARVTTEYEFSPRVFVPGMAQLHKGSTGKGVAFIAGEVAMIGGIILAESLRASNDSKFDNTKNDKEKENYANNADNWQNIRNGFIGGAVALYAWNVIDGWVAKGRKHVVIGDNRLRITPYASPNAGGFVLTLNF
jgi:hypothetical protein